LGGRGNSRILQKREIGKGGKREAGNNGKVLRIEKSWEGKKGTKSAPQTQKCGTHARGRGGGGPLRKGSSKKAEPLIM